MKTRTGDETFEERLDTYTQEVRCQFIIIEHVPARVCRETGEQLFSPDTVQKTQAIIGSRLKPARIMETPVYEFPEAAA